MTRTIIKENKDMDSGEKEQRRLFNFGKVAYWPTSRKSNAVTVEIGMKRLRSGEYEFTACGDIWNCRGTDILCGGQCLDTIREYVKDNDIFDEIYKLWSSFHLNGLNSGTIRQEEALRKETERRNAEHRSKGEDEEEPLVNANRYDDACDYLKSIGLYVDKLGDGEVLNYENPDEDVTSNHYPYGCGWITRCLDYDTMARIFSLINEGKVYRK